MSALNHYLAAGLIDNVRLYNRTVSAAEVQSLYLLEKAGTASEWHRSPSRNRPVTKSGLIAYYLFDQDEAGAVTDQSGSNTLVTEQVLLDGTSWTD